MKTSTKLLIIGIILTILIPFWIFKFIGILCIIGGIVLIIYQGITDIKAGSNKNNTPPWEK